VGHGRDRRPRHGGVAVRDRVDGAVGDFAAEFAQSTLENRQSEFLQLFAFVSLAALYVDTPIGTAELEASGFSIGLIAVNAPDAVAADPER
jgi:hypothetical protein